MEREIRVFRNVAQPTRLHLKFFHETGLILRCNGKAGIPFQTKQGNRPSCRDQEGRRSSDEVAPGTSVFLSSETGMSGNILGHISVPSTNSDFKMERGTYFETLYWERASSHDDGGVSWFFSSGGASVGFLARNDEEIREPLVWRQGTQVSIRVARGSAALL